LQQFNIKSSLTNRLKIRLFKDKCNECTLYALKLNNCKGHLTIYRICVYSVIADNIAGSIDESERHNNNCWPVNRTILSTISIPNADYFWSSIQQRDLIFGRSIRDPGSSADVRLTRWFIFVLNFLDLIEIFLSFCLAWPKSRFRCLIQWAKCRYYRDSNINVYNSFID